MTEDTHRQGGYPSPYYIPEKGKISDAPGQGRIDKIVNQPSVELKEG